MFTGLLTRFAYFPWGTFGELKVKDLTVYTVEKPYLNNQRFRSCIPEGLYYVSKHVSNKHGLCYSLEGEWVTKTIEEAREDQRFACLIHAANFPSQVEGCIAVGQTINIIPINGKEWPDSMGVTNSMATLNHMMEELPLEWALRITHRNGIKGPNGP